MTEHVVTHIQFRNCDNLLKLAQPGVSDDRSEQRREVAGHCEYMIDRFGVFLIVQQYGG